NAERLAARGLWVVCVDEIPNLQILERRPIRRARPGWIEHQEFEYTRHGTVNLLLFLIVHTGRMELAVESKKDAERYIGALRAFRRRHRGLHGAFLIQDGDPEPYSCRYGSLLLGLRKLVAGPHSAGPPLIAGLGRT